jgi:hypothetical protein
MKNNQLLPTLTFFFCFDLSFIAGVIPRDKVPTFELMLWRICRGNVFLRTAEIEGSTEDPTTVCITVS